MQDAKVYEVKYIKQSKAIGMQLAKFGYRKSMIMAVDEMFTERSVPALGDKNQHRMLTLESVSTKNHHNSTKDHEVEQI